MESKEQQVIDLTEQYMKLICSDHHKDRDCHWYINKVWSYGEKPYYRVEHYGYIYDTIELDNTKFYNYKMALLFMIRHLKEAIKGVERKYEAIQSDSDLSPYDLVSQKGWIGLNRYK